MNDLLRKLKEAEDTVRALQREIAQGPCKQYGHTWIFYGGANAGCDDICGCSVPVYVCSKCNDCDYGVNKEADEIRRNCNTANNIEEQEET